jgi:hypothetical protein
MTLSTRIPRAGDPLLATKRIIYRRTELVLPRNISMPGRRENDIWEGMGDAISIEYCFFWDCKCDDREVLCKLIGISF